MIDHSPPPYKVALVASDASLAQVFTRISKDMPCILSVRMGLREEEALEAALHLIKTEQPEVICARNGLAAYLQTEIETPVVTVTSTTVDLLRLLLPFKGKYRHVAFFRQQSVVPEVQHVAQALDMDIREYLFNSREEMTARMLEAAALDAQLGVGGPLVSGMRELCGVDGLVLEAGEEAVRRALGEALDIARINRQEQRRRARGWAVLNALLEGVVVTDENNNLSLINPAAEQLLNIKAEAALGRDADETLFSSRPWNAQRPGATEINEPVEINGQSLVTNRAPVLLNGRQIGVVSTLVGADRIRQAEQRLRDGQRAKGCKAHHQLTDVITHNGSMKEVKKLATGYAAAEASVLIQGESGSGKELFAQGIHLASRRASAPFVSLNCAAISPDLLESEFFGQEEGPAGVGPQAKPGCFELGHEGTLFLDEVNELPAHLQSRLLRVLHEGAVTRVGSSRSVPVDVRLICASHKNLQGMVARGHFRQDLFYRCNVLPLFIPPLRERGNDILHLACAFLRNSPHDSPFRTLTRDRLETEAGDLLLGHTWPGNVRELANMMERLALTSALFPNRGLREVLEQILAQMPEYRDGERHSLHVSRFSSSPGGGETLKDIVRRAEYGAIARELSACNGDYARVAKRLGISRVSLWRKLRERPQEGEQESAHVPHQ